MGHSSGFALFLYTLLVASTFCSAFGFTAANKAALRQERTKLSMGLFDFKPVHGSGSGKDVLDEQWEAQQAILRARRAGHIDKEHLKEKYKGGKSNQLANLMKEREEAYSHHVEQDVLPMNDNRKKKWFWET